MLLLLPLSIFPREQSVVRPFAAAALWGSNELNISYNRHVFSHNLESIKICKNYFKTWDFQWSLAWTFFRHTVFQKRRESGAFQNNLWKSLIKKLRLLLSKVVVCIDNSHYFHPYPFSQHKQNARFSQVVKKYVISGINRHHICSLSNPSLW